MADWFYRQLETHKCISSLLGVGCAPVLIRGNKQTFLSWLSQGVRSGELAFPAASGPVEWPRTTLDEIFDRQSTD